MNIDSCNVLVTNFSYPEDLNRIDSMSYICSTSSFEKVAVEKGLRLLLRFDDKNFSLFNYDLRTKLLYDKGNDLLFCFKHDIDHNDFSKESVESIYILDRNLFPQYVLRWRFYVDNKNYIEKIYYERESSKPYFLHIKLKRDIQPQLKELDYNDLIKITKELYKGEYTLTQERYALDSHFNTTPLWTDN